MTLTLAQAAKWPPRTESPITMLSPQWMAALANRPGKVACSGSNLSAVSMLAPVGQ
jgi:hypothetical protein